MTKRKNNIKLVISIISPVIITIILFILQIVKPDEIIRAGNDIQFNIISFSAIIAGFLFTGISILVSVIDKERIKRLWKNYYLDNLYRSAAVGIIANVISIIIALALVLCLTCESVAKWLSALEIYFIILGLIEFSWCVSKLFSVIRKLKDE